MRSAAVPHADSIGIPTLFITSRGDDQLPHALVEPMIKNLPAAGKGVEVSTAEKNPHGFYGARHRRRLCAPWRQDTRRGARRGRIAAELPRPTPQHRRPGHPSA